MIQFGIPPIRIDIMTSIDGVEFEEAYKHKALFKFDDIDKVFYISLKDLIQNKEKANRVKDKNDLSWIKTYGKNS